MRLAFVAIAAIFFVRTAQAADAKEKPCAQLQKQYVGLPARPWDLDKVHKSFGQPSRVDRGAYRQYDTLDDVLVFDFPGCYFFLCGQGGKGLQCP